MAIDLNTLKKAEGEINKSSTYSYGCIYKITNKVNGMVYVGQTVKNPVWTRIYGHLKPSGKKRVSRIQRVIQKHGTDIFDFEIIAYANSAESLNEFEKQFIEDYNSLSPNGYNLVSGGMVNRSLSDEARQNLSLALKGKPSWIKGKNLSKEHKANISKSHMGIKATEVQKRKQAEAKTKFRIKRIDPKTLEEKIYNLAMDIKRDGFCYQVVFRIVSGYKDHKTHKGYQWVKMEKAQSCQ